MEFITTIIKRFVAATAAVILLAFLCIGYEFYMVMPTRRDALSSFVRMATTDALINIQSTEQYGDDFLNEGYLSPDEIADLKANETNNYTNYLTILDTELKNKKLDNSDNIGAVHSFLDSNKNKTGNDRFRPIQFGMTYISEDLFKSSFSSYLNNIIKTNYAINDTDTDIVITGIDYDISDPQVAKIPSSKTASDEDKKLYMYLYGTDIANDKLKNWEELGLGSGSIDFYVFYKVKVTVNWASAMHTAGFQKGFMTKYGVPETETDANGNTRDLFNSQGAFLAAGQPVTYEYTYVLTN